MLTKPVLGQYSLVVLCAASFPLHVHRVDVSENLQGCLHLLCGGVPVEAPRGLLGGAEVDRKAVGPHFFRQLYSRKHLINDSRVWDGSRDYLLGRLF